MTRLVPDAIHRSQQVINENVAEALLEYRRRRRKRRLDQLEIPEDHVLVSDELLGRGGFGAVYVADYNGRNAAAKVVQLENEQVDFQYTDGDTARPTAGKVI